MFNRKIYIYILVIIIVVLGSIYSVFYKQGSNQERIITSVLNEYLDPSFNEVDVIEVIHYENIAHAPFDKKNIDVIIKLLPNYNINNLYESEYYMGYVKPSKYVDHYVREGSTSRFYHKKCHLFLNNRRSYSTQDSFVLWHEYTIGILLEDSRKLYIYNYSEHPR